MRQASNIIVVLSLLLLPSIAAFGSNHEIALYGRAKGERPCTMNGECCSLQCHPVKGTCK